MFGRFQTSKTGGQPYNDTSPMASVLLSNATCDDGSEVINKNRTSNKLEPMSQTNFRVA